MSIITNYEIIRLFNRRQGGRVPGRCGTGTKHVSPNPGELEAGAASCIATHDARRGLHQFSPSEAGRAARRAAHTEPIPDLGFAWKHPDVGFA